MEPPSVRNRETYHRRLRRSHSLFLTPTSLLVLFVAIALAFSIFKPNTMMNSWNPINFVLLLLAIARGFHSKDNTSENTPRFNEDRRRRRSFSNPATPPPRCGYEYKYEYEYEGRSWVADEERRQFYDDPDSSLLHRQPRPEAEEGEHGFENVPMAVTSGEVGTTPPPQQQSCPPPPPPPATGMEGAPRKAQQTYQAKSTDFAAGNSQPPPQQEPVLQQLISPSPSPSPSLSPPPLPPPPFKVPAWKFRVKGDYVRIDSIGSSRSGSLDSDESVDSPSSQQEASQRYGNRFSAPDGGELANATACASSLFCPSPDVDTKAHRFIESFRAGLRMKKMNSIKGKQRIARSNLVIQ